MVLTYLYARPVLSVWGEQLKVRRSRRIMHAPRSTPPPLPPSLAAREASPAHAAYHRLLSHSKSHPPPANPPAHLDALAAGLAPLANTPVLVLGVQSDILFPVEQQREVADALRVAGNQMVSYYELGGVWGHDTFL